MKKSGIILKMIIEIEKYLCVDKVVRCGKLISNEYIVHVNNKEKIEFHKITNKTKIKTIQERKEKELFERYNLNLFPSQGETLCLMSEVIQNNYSSTFIENKSKEKGLEIKVTYSYLEFLKKDIGENIFSHKWIEEPSINENEKIKSPNYLYLTNNDKYYLVKGNTQAALLILSNSSGKSIFN